MKACEIEKVHTSFLKRIIGVKRSTNNAMIYNETGRVPLVIRRKFNIVKNWLKLTKTENCILKSIYETELEDCIAKNSKNWINEIQKILHSTGMSDVWLCQHVADERIFLFALKQRLTDIAFQNIDTDINISSKCFLYKHFIYVRGLQPYLCKPISPSMRILISKIRLSSHKLCIETGRYTGVIREDRICHKCNLGVIEDEYHFILQCPFYTNIRHQYIKAYFYRRPSAFKLVQLLCSESTKELCNLAKYIKTAFSMREKLNSRG